MALSPFRMFRTLVSGHILSHCHPGCGSFPVSHYSKRVPLCTFIILRADLCSHCPIRTSLWELPRLSTPSAVAHLDFSPAQEARFAPHTLGKTATTRCTGSSKPSTSPPIWVTLHLQLSWKGCLEASFIFLLPSQGQLLVCSVSDLLVPLLSLPPSQKFKFFRHLQRVPSLFVKVFHH